MSDLVPHRSNLPAIDRPLTAQQRVFCQRLIAGASGAEAARLAGYGKRGAAQQANRLMRNAKVQQEVERLRGSSELRARAELDRLLAKVESVFAKAMRDNQCSAALRAIELEALLRGRGARSFPDDVSPAEVMAEQQRRAGID